MIASGKLTTLSAVTALALLSLVVSSTYSLAPAISRSSSNRQARQRQQDEPCHLRELDLCLASVAVFTQNSNQHPINNAEITRQCKILTETETCLKNYTSRCMTEDQAELVDMFAEGGLNVINELCKSQSKLRSNYLKYGNCVNDQNKAQRVCLRDFQVSLEKAVDIDWQDRLKLACCAFNKVDACMHDVIVPKCGIEAYEMHRELFRVSVSRLPSITCAKYDHSSKACAKLLPPAGSTPKGSKSHSVLSKLFSAYTGQ